jgi:Tol biopolymer transport system component
MKNAFILALILASVGTLFAQESPLWLRYPAISPDGNTILFEYKGDIWSVPSTGGTAVPLTLSESYEFSPVWSHDGRSIAFASDRYGNFDVLVMPGTGGEATRLTFNSSREVPSTFSADDKSILFNGNRQDLVTNAQFPAGGMAELYSVPVAGGRVSQVLTTPAFDATVDSKGDKIIFHDYKGYESDWRKHHTSSVTRDVWVYDVPSKKYTQLSSFNGEDRNPVFDSNDNDFYFLSEQNGSFNIFKSSLAKPDRSTPVTKFTKHPVRFLTRSKSGTLAFSYDGELYTMKPGGEPSKVSVRIGADGRGSIERIVPVNGGFT